MVMPHWGLPLDKNLTKWLSVNVLFKEQKKKTHTMTIWIRKKKNSKENRMVKMENMELEKKNGKLRRLKTSMKVEEWRRSCH